MRRQPDSNYVEPAGWTQTPENRRDRQRPLGSMPLQYAYQPLILSRPRDRSAETNHFIDAICALTPQEAHNLEWILDLEFGPPHSRPPSHRHIAYYDPTKRIIMSASQANTVHPDFLRCNERFRDVLVEQYTRREVQGSMQTPVGIQHNYHELYRIMDEQKKMQNALLAAAARRTYRPA